MTKKIFLWVTVLLFSFHFSGHLFDIIANQPNWKSGSVDDVSTLAGFYHSSNPAYFFAPIIFASVLASLVTCILIWRSGKATKKYSVATFIIAVLVMILTVSVFVPINDYMFNSPVYDAALLSQKVSLWIKMEYVRVAIIGLGLVTSIGALNNFSK